MSTFYEAFVVANLEEMQSIFFSCKSPFILSLNEVKVFD